MDFSKKIEESPDDYLIRLGDYKQLTGELTWVDIGEMLFQATGIRHLPDSWGRKYRGMKDRQISEESIPTLSPEVQEMYEEKAEKISLTDECNQLNAIYKTLAREDSLKQMAREAVSIMAEAKPLLDFSHNQDQSGMNEALLIISDWHYGIDIHNYVNVYSPEICKQRVSELTSTVIAKIKTNKISKLYVLNLGDMIAGNIHLPLRLNSRKDVITQIMEVSEILAEMLHTLSMFVSIEYYSVLDNHSRIDPNKKDSIQLESLARITKWYLQNRFVDSNNIDIMDNEIDEDIAAFTVGNDFNVVGVHGDKDRQADIIAKLNLFVGHSINLICSAHLHHFSGNEDNRTLLISNGSLMGTDEYAFQKRLDSSPSQTLVTFKQVDDVTDIDGIYKINSYIYS